MLEFIIGLKKRLARGIKKYEIEKRFLVDERCICQSVIVIAIVKINDIESKNERGQWGIQEKQGMHALVYSLLFTLLSCIILKSASF